MAVGDIYFCKTNTSWNTRGWSWGVWLEEITPAAPSDTGQTPAAAWYAHINTAYLNILSNECRFESVECWRRHPTSSRPGLVNVVGGIGTVSGPALPNNCTLYVKLLQSASDARHNTGVHISGCSRNQTDNNEFLSAHLTGPIKTFTDLLDDVINAAGGDSGQWRVVCLSKTYLPASTPIGTPFDVTKAVANARIMTQRRRGAKVLGWS